MTPDKKLLARCVAFSGEEELSNHDTVAEIVDFTKTGQIEIAFNAQLEGSPRIYLALSLPDLIALGMSMVGNNDL
ncbi:hypothetical protein OS670_19965 [Pseudomonadaceae bacterium T75]|nr:hypothetical protein OS670_19965 [Pseudomonadaceae bacterium T75]